MREKRGGRRYPEAPGAILRPLAGRALGQRIPGLVELWRELRAYSGRPISAPVGAAGLSGAEIEEAGAALLSLQRGLTGERALSGARYMEDPAFLGAYLLYYWPVSYMQTSVAMASSGLSPRRVLDLGSGPAPVSAALADALGQNGALERVVLADYSLAALDLGAAVLGRGPFRPGRIELAKLDLEADSDIPEGPFDLVAFGHCLNELRTSLEVKLGLIELASGRLAPGGAVLLLEPALQRTSRALIELRDGLAGRGWKVLGPCTGSFPCPAFAAGPDRSCHAESPWAPPEPVASLARVAGLDRSAVKLAYFLLAPPGSAGAERAGRPEGLRRVVSEPMLNKAGRLRYILCGSGALETISARADDAEALAKGFMSLRRGDLLVPNSLEPRPGGGLGFAPGTELGLVEGAPEAST